MKVVAKTLTLLFFSLQISFGQIQAHQVSYTDKRYFDREEMNIPATANLPESMDRYFILKTTTQTSTYQSDIEKTKAEQKKKEALGQKRRWWGRRKSQDNYYKNLKTGLFTNQSNLFGKDFLVTDTLESWKWKISAGEQREVLGYTCMKAEFRDSISIIEAWFTPQITISNGPANFGGLPGLILEMRLENRNIVASSVETIEIDEEYEHPTKGDLVTKEEYDEIREEKMAERKKMWGGAGKRKY